VVAVSQKKNATPRNIPTKDEGLSALPDVLEFTPLHFAWLDGQSWMLAFQGLHPGQLINAHHPLALLSEFGRLLVELVDSTHLFIEIFIRGRGQPITD